MADDYVAPIHNGSEKNDVKQRAFIALLNARLEDGEFSFEDGFKLQRWPKEPPRMPLLQGYPAPVPDPAALCYERSGTGLLCFDREFLANARLLLALIELRARCRLWFSFVLAEAEDLKPSDGRFFLAAQTVLPNYGDLDNYPDPEICLYRDELEAVARVRPALTQESKAARTAGIAVRRWASCRERLDDQDAVLDAWIGLEGIYLRRDDTKRELVSRRIACYVTKDVTGKSRESASDVVAKKAYAWAFDAYGVRSKIIHGNSVDPAAAREARWHSESLLARTLLPLLFDDELKHFNPKKLV